MPNNPHRTPAVGSQLPPGWSMAEEVQFAPGQEADNVAMALATFTEAQEAAQDNPPS